MVSVIPTGLAVWIGITRLQVWLLLSSAVASLLYGSCDFLLAAAARDDHRDNFEGHSCLEVTEIVVETYDKSFSSWSDCGDLHHKPAGAKH